MEKINIVFILLQFIDFFILANITSSFLAASSFAWFYWRRKLLGAKVYSSLSHHSDNITSLILFVIIITIAIIINYYLFITSTILNKDL